MTSETPLTSIATLAEAPADRDPVGRVAIVHDYLNQRGGAEKVVLEISNMWPQAPIYTSLYRAGSTFEEFRGRAIRTSFLDRIPVDKGFRGLFPLYPAAFRGFGEIEADVVISSSSGWAHMVRGVQNALHVVYCHTPARWLYGEAYLHHGRVATAQRLAAPLLRRMRRIDGQAALHVDAYVANSESVRKRVRVAYGRESSVVYPPVDVQRFRPSPRGERLLVISRLLPYKRVDLAIAAARRLGIGLDVVGDGPLRSELRREAGPLTTFYGAASDATVTELLATCSAVCVPGEEDFGIVAVEAQAAGKPVVAFARGGACETVVHGVTGVLFTVQSVECVVSAIAEAARLSTPPDRIAANAARFSRAAFADGLRRAISTLRESHGATRLAVEVGSA